MSETEDALNDEGLDLIFRRARSYNGYTSWPVTETEIRRIWELTKMGPTSANQSPARIVWCTTPESKEKLAACCKPKNGDKVRKAPVTAIIGMDLRFFDHLPRLFPHTDARTAFAEDPVLAQTSAFRNSSLQGAYLILAARALGLDTGPMSGFDHKAVDAAFFAGTSVKSNFLCTVGHGDPTSIFARLPRLKFEEANTVI